jgi:hypothetical protein
VRRGGAGDYGQAPYRLLEAHMTAARAGQQDGAPYSAFCVKSMVKWLEHRSAEELGVASIRHVSDLPFATTLGDQHREA